MSYLEEAAAEVRAALAANGEFEAATRHLEDHGPVREQIRAERLRLLDRMIAIAAVEAGLPSCAHRGPGDTA